MTDKILLFSAGRTGSTFVYQVLKELFGDRVIKSHEHGMRNNYFSLGLDCVLTERNHVDSYLSRLRVIQSDGDNEHFLKNLSNKNYLYSEISNYKRELDYVRFVKNNYRGRLLCLDYEKFAFNFSYLLDSFSSFFNIEISETKRREIEIETSRSKNILRQKEFKSFTQHDEETHIHGSHIFSQTNLYSMKLLGNREFETLNLLLS